MKNNNNVYIPTHCKVGFNIREDTFTKKLGYIIYKKDNEWKQEKSWNNWRQKYISPEEFEAKKLESFNNLVAHYTKEYNKHKNTPKPNYWSPLWQLIDESDTLEDFLKLQKVDSLENYRFNIYGSVPDETINPIEFDNIPLEGFVLNKKVGGHRSGWNHRNAYARVYHPLGFEFEISFENVLYLLENTNFIVGKGIEGKCLLGWQGKNIVLIPENSSDYSEYENFTKAQHVKNVKLSTLKTGHKYKTRQGETWLYLGKHLRYIDTYLHREVKEEDIQNVKTKSTHWFCNVDRNNAHASSYNYFFKDTCSVIIEELEEETDIQKYYDKLSEDLSFSGFEYKLELVDDKEVQEIVKRGSSYVNGLYWFYYENGNYFQLEYISQYSWDNTYRDTTWGLKKEEVLNKKFYKIVKTKLSNG